MLEKHLFVAALEFARAYKNTNDDYISVINNATHRGMVLFHNKNFDVILFKFIPYKRLTFEYYVASHTAIDRISNQAYLSIFNGWRKNARLVREFKQSLAYTSIW